MYQEVKEPIDVMMAFKSGKPEPLFFNWNNRQYKIDRVNLVHHERRGREKVYVFSVSDRANAFRLKFFTETLKWELEEVAML
jgi:hypothetical protein